MDKSRPTTFGYRLKQHRLAADLTQEELAERAGLSARGIADIERGVIRSPQRHTAHQLAAALELPAPDRAALEQTVVRRRGPRAGPDPYTDPAPAPRAQQAGRDDGAKDGEAIGRTSTGTPNVGLAYDRPVPAPASVAGAPSLGGAASRRELQRSPRPLDATEEFTAPQPPCPRPDASVPAAAPVDTPVDTPPADRSCALAPNGAERATGRSAAQRATAWRKRMSRHERYSRALTYLRAAGPISPGEYARALGVGRRTAGSDLRLLAERGVVREQGSAPDRRYALCPDDQPDQWDRRRA